MARKVRKQIYLDARQEKWLKSLSKRTRVPEAQIIRDALDQHRAEVRFPTRDPMEAWNAEREYIEKHITARLEPQPPSEGRGWTRDDAYDRYRR